MLLKGLQKLTLLDYPGKIACTVFTGGCNFRCPFCHNASLVIPEKFGVTIPEEELFSFLEKRRGVLEGVCVSGGEPTLQPDIEDFLGRIKALGYFVKLDTNGARPDVLSRLVSAGLADYVAMDIKNSPERYSETVGIGNFDISPIRKSAEFLLSGAVDFEFRTTVVRQLHREEDIRAIGEWLSGSEKFFIQPFRDSGDLVGEGLSGYSEAEIATLLDIIRKFVPLAQIRG